MEEGSTPWKRAPLHSMEEASTPLHGSPWWGIPLNSLEGDSTQLNGKISLNSVDGGLYSMEVASTLLYEMGLHYTPWRGTPLHSMEYKRRTGHQDKSTG
jgi:hypothetical protein